MPLLVENLTHNYTQNATDVVAAIHDINMEIADGEFLGIIGHTGSGKSTLIQHFNALLLPSAGRVVVNGIDLADKKMRKQIRAQVGMVFQYPEYQLFGETVEEDIAFGPRNIDVPENEICDRVKDAMKKVNLDYDLFAQKSPFELSGGQKRRVALAGILAMRPSILVLDEPMAGLDPKGRNEFMQFLRGFHASGITIIMVSHSMEDIAALVQRVAVLNKGSLVFLDTPQQVFKESTRLKEMGLDIPHAAAFAEKLRVKGLPVPAEIISMKELSNWIVAYRGIHDAQ